MFIRNFNMTVEVSGTLLYIEKTQYLCTLVRGEALRQFDMFSNVLGMNTSENSKFIIMGLGTYFLLLMRCQNKSAQYAA